MARRLEKFFPILYTGRTGLVAHECIIDCRPLAEKSGVTVEDIAKRLMDYGFHAPTMSWPVTGTLMIEPTESESKPELDRFCDAMASIHGEIQEIMDGTADAQDNVLKNAPHTSGTLCANDWPHPYTREQAAFPLPYLRTHKFWPVRLPHRQRPRRPQPRLHLRQRRSLRGPVGKGTFSSRGIPLRHFPGLPPPHSHHPSVLPPK